MSIRNCSQFGVCSICKTTSPLPSLSPKVIWEKFTWIAIWLLTIYILFGNPACNSDWLTKITVMIWIRLKGQKYCIDVPFLNTDNMMVFFFLRVITSYSLFIIFILLVNGDSCNIRLRFLDCLLSSPLPAWNSFVYRKGLQKTQSLIHCTNTDKKTYCGLWRLHAHLEGREFKSKIKRLKI